MRHRVVISGLCVAVLLSGCIESYREFKQPKEPTCVAVTDGIKKAKDWSRYLPVIYVGLKGCMKAHPSGMAYVGDVIPNDDGTMLVRIQGADGSIYSCLTEAKRTTPLEVTPGPDSFDSPGPAFRPNVMGKPAPDRCSNHAAVHSCSGLPLGWLTYFRC